MPALSDPVQQGDESESVRLFLLAAQRAAGDFRLTDGNRQAVYAICRHVAGMPLAIELAAAWLRAMSCDEIARRLTAGLALLVSAYAPSNAHHASVSTLFEHSWRLLNPREQRILAQAALTPGSFTASALEAQAGATPFDLAGVVSQSLVRLLDNGRYQMHTLVRQFAQEQLGADPAGYAAAIAIYCEYYAGWVEQQAVILEQNGEHQATLGLLSAEVENIQAAWGFLLARASRDAASAIARLAVGTRRLYERIGWFAEGVRLYTHARAHLENFPASLRQSAEWVRAYSRVTGQSAIFDWYLNRLSVGRASLQESLAVLGPGPEWDPERHFALRHLGIIAWQSEEYAVARRYVQQARACVGSDRLSLAKTDVLHGIIAYAEAAYTEAEAMLERGIHTLERFGELRYRSYALDALIGTHIALGARSAAEERIPDLQAIADIFRSLDDSWALTAVLLRMGQRLTQLGAWVAAEQSLQEALSIAADSRIHALELEVKMGLAALWLAQQPGTSQRRRAALTLLAEAGQSTTSERVRRAAARLLASAHVESRISC